MGIGDVIVFPNNQALARKFISERLRAAYGGTDTEVLTRIDQELSYEDSIWDITTETEVPQTLCNAVCKTCGWYSLCLDSESGKAALRQHMVKAHRWERECSLTDLDYMLQFFEPPTDGPSTGADLVLDFIDGKSVNADVAREIFLEHIRPMEGYTTRYHWKDLEQGYHQLVDPSGRSTMPIKDLLHRLGLRKKTLNGRHFWESGKRNATTTSRKKSRNK